MTDTIDTPTLTTIELETPLIRGDDRIAVLTIGEIRGFALQGMSLVALGQMGFDEVRHLVARISVDGLIVEEVDRIAADDIMSIAHELGQLLSPVDSDLPIERSDDTDRPGIIKVPLRMPITREKGDVGHVTLRRGDSGELRGLSLAELGQMQYDALRTYLGRITLEVLKPHEIDAMHGADLMRIAGEVGGFLLPRRLRTA